jgi:general secretion pathway protein H
VIAGAVRALPASATRRSQHGFTLLELLAVIVIIGIIVTFASLSIGNRALDDRLEAEARRLEQLLKLAEDEADLKGIAIGLVFTREGYRFLASDTSSNWVDYAQSGVLRSRPLLQPFFTELRMEGRLIPALTGDAAAKTDRKPDGNGQDEADKLKPQVLLLPGGQMTPFTLDLKAPDYPSYFRIEGDLLGRVTRERKTVDSGARR